MWAAVSAGQCLLWASTVAEMPWDKWSRKLLCPVSGLAPMLGGAVTSDKHRKGQKVSLVELERRGERMAMQPVTQQGCAVMMVGATRTSWGVLQGSQEQLLTVFACFCNF